MCRCERTDQSVLWGTKGFKSRRTLCGAFICFWVSIHIRYCHVYGLESREFVLCEKDTREAENECEGEMSLLASDPEPADAHVADLFEHLPCLIVGLYVNAVSRRQYCRSPDTTGHEIIMTKS